MMRSTYLEEVDNEDGVEITEQGIRRRIKLSGPEIGAVYATQQQTQNGILHATTCGGAKDVRSAPRYYQFDTARLVGIPSQEGPV